MMVPFRKGFCSSMSLPTTPIPEVDRLPRYLQDKGVLPPPEAFLFVPGQPTAIGWLREWGFRLEALTFDETNLRDGISVNSAKPLLSGDVLVLPEPGVYVGRDGDQGVVFLGVPARNADRTELTFRYIAGSVLGMYTDDNEDIYNATAEMVALSFMTPDRIIHSNCGPTAWLICLLLSSMGVFARPFWIAHVEKSPEGGRFHVAAEAYLADEQTWQMIDAHHGMLFDSGFSALAFTRLEWDVQKKYLMAQVPKPHVHENYLAHFRARERIISPLLEERRAITLKNPCVSMAETQAVMEDLPCVTALLPLEQFCAQAYLFQTHFWPDEEDALRHMQSVG